jgi:hypothetical protein
MINEIKLSTTELNQDTNLTLDLDLATQKTDVLAFKDASDLIINNDANINVTSVNVINMNTALTDSEYQIELLKDEYNNTGLTNNLNINIDEQNLLTPIFKYNLSTSINNPSTLFMNRGATSKLSSYNPAVFAAPVAAQVGGYLTQLHTYDMAFGNMDMNMLMSYDERQAMKLRNKYAMSGVQSGNKLMTFSPNQLPEESRGMWFKPFATFEKVDLSNTSIDNLGVDFFRDCSNLKTVYLPETLDVISKNTFKNCSNLTTLKMFDSVHRIDESAFDGCLKLESVDLTSEEAVNIFTMWTDFYNKYSF